MVKTHIKESDYSGPVFWGGHDGSGGEGYFASTAEIREYCEQEGLPLPGTGDEGPAHACTIKFLALDADEVIEQALEGGEFHADAKDNVSEGAMAALRASLAQWNDKYGKQLESWFDDPTHIIDFEEPTP